MNSFIGEHSSIRSLGTIAFVRTVKREHLPAILTLLLTAIVSTQLSAQQGSASHARDPAAEATIQAALTAMGGNAGWSAVKSAKVTFSVQAADGSLNQRSLQFDWSLSELRSRLDVGTGAASRRIVSDPTQSTLTMTQDSKGKQVQGRTVWLPEELPGLAFYLALTDTRWEIIQSIPTQKHPEPRIVLRRRTRGLPDMATEQDWAFDSTTGKPTSVISYAPTISHSGLFLEIRTDFREFASSSGLMTPTAIDRRYGQGRTTTETFQSPTFGQAMSETAFSLSGGLRSE